jgi:CAAX prenyl protease-like protein
MSDFNERAEYRRAGGAAGGATEPIAPGATDTTSAGADIFPYVAPMFAYVGLTALEGYLPQLVGKPIAASYPIAYGTKLFLVALLAWHYRATWIDFCPPPSLGKIALGVLTGVLVCAAWVGLDGLYPTIKLLGSRSAFDPLALDAAARWAFIALRLLGLVVLVPVIEELFWRSFLMRWVIDNDFLKVPIGKVTPIAAAVTSVLFALAHPEWLPAALTGALWAWLLWSTKSLSACVISHATANLALGIYVIATHDWKFW